MPESRAPASPWLTSRRNAALVRTVYWGPARAAFRVVGPSYLLATMIAGFIFGGQGLHPRTLVDWMLDTRFGLVLGYGAWWLFSGRGYRAAFADPAVTWLRSFPLKRATSALAFAPLLLALEAPWLALWTIGTQDTRLVITLPLWALGLGGHLLVLTHRPQTRRRSPRAAWVLVPFTLSRWLWRRFPLAFVVLGVGWFGATELCVLMGERAVESVATRLEFTATTSSAATLVSAASLRWLLHGELLRANWLLTSGPRSTAQTACFDVAVAAGLSLVCLTMSVGVLALRLPTLALGLAGTLWPAGATSILAATLVPLLARGRNPSRAPVRAVLLIVPYLVVVQLSAAPLLHGAVLLGCAAVAFLVRVHWASPFTTRGVQV